MKVLKVNPLYIGITCALMSYFVYAVSDAFKKLLAAEHSVIDIQFWNSGFTILFILIWGLFKKDLPQIVKSTQPYLHVYRAIVMLPILFGITYVLRYMPLVNFYAIIFTTPFITAILAHIFFKELLNIKIIGIICLGFSGVLIAYPPTIETITTPLIMTIGIAFCISCLVLSFKIAAKGEHKLTYVLYPHIFAMLLSYMFSTNELFDFSWLNFGYCAGVGILVLLGTVYAIKAYQAAPAAVVSVVHYSQMFYGALLGYFIFGDIPSWNVVTGIFVVLMAGIALTFSSREKKQS